jgi:hypothetical protein
MSKGPLFGNPKVRPESPAGQHSFKRPNQQHQEHFGEEDHLGDAYSRRQGSSKMLKTQAKKSFDVPSVESKIMRLLGWLLDHTYMAVTMALLTVYALFGDDVRLAFTDVNADETFYAISSICLVCFSLEIILQWIVRPEYRWGFYFWLDFASTISLIPDIGWLWDPMMDAFEPTDQTSFYDQSTEENSQGSEQSSEALRASRASRAGTKAGRIVRIVRLVRMVRMVKLVKLKQQHQQRQLDEMYGTEDQEEMDINYRAKMEPSNVGNRLTELITHRVIMITLLLIVMTPFLDGGLSEDSVHFQESLLADVFRYPRDFNDSGTISTETYKGIFQDYARQVYDASCSDGHGRCAEVLYMEVCKENCGHSTWSKAVTDDWLLEVREEQSGTSERLWSFQEIEQARRPLEQIRVMHTGCGSLTDTREVDEFGDMVQRTDNEAGAAGLCRAIAIIDNKRVVQYYAMVSIGKTLFVMVMLVGAILLFTRDAQSLVIEPISRMMELVRKLAENPLANIGTAVATNKPGEGGGEGHTALEIKESAAGYETQLLEKSIRNIGVLLQIGLGQAGTEIIGKNMTGAGGLDVMLPGKKITCVFGFGIIDHFIESCSCLEEKICMYTNLIASIVHRDTHQYYGAANKNIGQAFLLCWRICEGMLPGLRDHRDNSTEAGKDESKVGEAAAALVGDGKASLRSSDVGDTGSAKAYPDERSDQRRDGHGEGADGASDGASAEGGRGREGLPSAGVDELVLSRQMGQRQGQGGVSAAEALKNIMRDQERERQARANPIMLKGGGIKARMVPPQEMVDSALTAFLKIRVDLHHANADMRKGQLGTYNKEHARELGDGYEVEMGFGLHIGWAIEGAIGSKFKIDASYLSPYVNPHRNLLKCTRFRMVSRSPHSATSFNTGM